MNYGELIKDAFRITWRNKFLWFFGFFAAGGSSGGFNFPSGGGGDFDFDDNDFEQSGAATSMAMQFGQGLLDNLTLILAIIGVVLLIVLVFIVLNIISQGALAESVAAIDRGERRRFGTTWRAGTARFWRVLGYYVIFILISLGLLLLIGLVLGLPVLGVFLGTESIGARVAAGILAGLTGIALLIAVFIPLAIIGQYALREIAVRGEGVIDSVGGGYRLFRRNIGRSLLVWLIQLGLMLGLAIVYIIALILVGIVLFLPAIALGFAEYTVAAVIAGVVAALILLPLLIVTSAALGTFNHAYWTLAYLRLEGPLAAPGPSAP
jgi:hypothetical protein